MLACEIFNKKISRHSLPTISAGIIALGNNAVGLYFLHHYTGIMYALKAQGEVHCWYALFGLGQILHIVNTPMIYCTEIHSTVEAYHDDSVIDKYSRRPLSTNLFVVDRVRDLTQVNS